MDKGVLLNSLSQIPLPSSLLNLISHNSTETALVKMTDVYIAKFNSLLSFINSALPLSDNCQCHLLHMSKFLESFKGSAILLL